ncbi:hypothetical protein EF096_15385 [Pseudomonas neustonica]|uniref:Uncharacterized protein n=1 Tax=Pseudomonas neustonica TaxID=2487346 RepID=A0ABX9XEW5_9PSED|nr:MULTISPECIES: hypothetical protein [Pseudomonas]MAB23602.1 hypothetical protein [Pseudomonadales bacterium]ROZ81031.1 hypothetical protein EF099_15975 [Pseudomonas sp. SSM44]ROZ82293.1 hypothetical protein EF096_15385 [Pseudomonas neustonica]
MNNRSNERFPLRMTLLSAALLPLLSLSGCNDGDGDDDNTDATPATGTFVDSPVSGLDYQGDESRQRPNRCDWAIRLLPG